MNMKRHVSLTDIQSNFWNSKVNKFGVLARFVFRQALLNLLKLN